jgi:predicted nucleotidyltransferase
MDQLDREIIKTREYGSQFGVVYSSNELKKRLISSQKYSDEILLKKLKSYKSVKITSKSIFTKSKLEKVENFINQLAKFFPDILMVTVTGSVAAGYCRENDDIDLMIITRQNRLWINRLLLRLYVSLHKIPHRKFGLRENKDDLCFNLWIEEGEMKLPKNKQTLRNAMDTILMVPILNKESTYEKFLAENDWVGKFVRNRYEELLGDFKWDRSKTRTGFDLISIINWLVFWPQWWYMKGKISSEVVGLRTAFFHPSDRIRYASEDNW